MPALDPSGERLVPRGYGFTAPPTAGLPPFPYDPSVPMAGGGSPSTSPSLPPMAPPAPAPAPTPGAGQAPMPTPNPYPSSGPREREIGSANDFFRYVGGLMNPGGDWQNGYIGELLRQLRQRQGTSVFSPNGLNDLAGGGFSHTGAPTSGVGSPSQAAPGAGGGFLGGLFGLLGGR